MSDPAPVILVGGYDPVLHAYACDVRTGGLTHVSSSAGGPNPSYLAVHGRFAYGVNETADGRVTAFALDAATGGLTRINDVPSCGADPCHVSVHPSGRAVYVSNYTGGTLAVLGVRADGGLEPAAAGQVFAPGANAHMALPVGSALVLAPFLGADAVWAYAADPATGALTPAGCTQLAAGAGPRHVCVSPDGATAYVINELDLTLTSFALQQQQQPQQQQPLLAPPGAGGEGAGATVGATAAAAAAPASLLSAPQTLPLLPGGVSGPVPGVSGAHVVASPDGRHVYASVRGPNADTSGVAVYSTNTSAAASGDAAAPRLSWVGWETAGGDVAVPRDFALSPDGSIVVVASQATDSVVVLARDAATGGLSKLRTTRTAGAKPCFVGWLAQ